MRQDPFKCLLLFMTWKAFSSRILLFLMEDYEDTSVILFFSDYCYYIIAGDLEIS